MQCTTQSRGTRNRGPHTPGTRVINNLRHGTRKYVQFAPWDTGTCATYVMRHRNMRKLCHGTQEYMLLTSWDTGIYANHAMEDRNNYVQIMPRDTGMCAAYAIYLCVT